MNGIHEVRGSIPLISTREEVASAASFIFGDVHRCGGVSTGTHRVRQLFCPLQTSAISHDRQQQRGPLGHHSHRLEVAVQVGGNGASESTGSTNALAASNTSSSVAHGSESSTAIDAYGSRHSDGGAGSAFGRSCVERNENVSAAAAVVAGSWVVRGSRCRLDPAGRALGSASRRDGWAGRWYGGCSSSGPWEDS